MGLLLRPLSLLALLFAATGLGAGAGVAVEATVGDDSDVARSCPEQAQLAASPVTAGQTGLADEIGASVFS